MVTGQGHLLSSNQVEFDQMLFPVINHTRRNKNFFKKSKQKFNSLRVVPQNNRTCGSDLKEAIPPPPKESSNTKLKA